MESELPPPVTELSSESSSDGYVHDEHPQPQLARVGKKRKRQQVKWKQADDAVGVQVLLSKNCLRKPDSCRNQFRSKSGVAALVAFKREWKGLHKLDQDELVPWLTRFFGRLFADPARLIA